MSYTLDANSWNVWDEAEDGSKVTYIGEIRANRGKFIAISPEFKALGTYAGRSGAKQALIREHKKSL